jgi:hypothetical protein
MENLEIRVLSTGKGWRVDTLKIGADERRTVSRVTTKENATGAALELARSLTRMGQYGTITVMIQELF